MHAKRVQILSLYETNPISVSAEPIPKHHSIPISKFGWYAGTGKINFFLREHANFITRLYLCTWKGEGSTAWNSSAQKNCSTPKSWLLDTVRADANKNETAWKTPKKSCRADAIFRPKWSTARIATAWQKHWKMSTARI